MADLSLRFLGTTEIELDGALVHLDRRYSLALLAYLALTGRTHSRDELATLLADNVSEETARKRLRNALADLVEHGLGPFLVANRQTVAFNIALPYQCDVHELDELAGSDTDVDLARLTWAAERCDRELLAGLSLRDAASFELWLVGEREHRGRQLQQVSERLLNLYVRSGDMSAGIGVARRLIDVAPWNENLHLALMRLLARDGQIEEALIQYERCREALHNEFDVEPQPETMALFERLRSGSVAPRHNLPGSALESDEIIGREEQLTTLMDRLVDPSCRLLTLVGLGGSGKTSLAIAAAARLARPSIAGEEHPFADGIIQVNLTDTIEDDVGTKQGQHADRRIATAIGFALGMAFYGKIDRLSQLIAYLEPKRMLLIVNNLEIVSDGGPTLLRVLQRAPNITFLVTSRMPIGLADEWTFEPGGLAIPAIADEVPDTPASQLFLREAHRVGAAIREEDWPDIVAICRLTGGLPLALKIVSGWLGPLSCAAIARELGQGGALLDEPASLAEAAHISIRSIVSSAYEALPTREQHALMRLAVFPGHFDRRAAAAVGVTAPGLVALRQRSLIERNDDDGYALHPLVSQYAMEQLAHETEYEAEARDHHATYFASFVEQMSQALYTTPDAHSMLGEEKANVRAAWDWAAQQQDADLLGSLWEGLSVWHHRAGLHREWTHALSAAISALREAGHEREQRVVLVELLVAKAESLLWQGDLDTAFPLLSEAREYADATDLLQLQAMISFCEGRLLRFRGGENSAAEETLHQARALARATNQQRIEANSLLQLGFSATDSEQYREAESYVRRAEEMFRSLGDRLALARTANHIGRLSVIRGDYTQAQLSMEQSLHFARTFGDRFLESYSQMHLGVIHDVGFGRHREAARYFERALSIANQTGDPYLDGNIHRAMGRNALHIGALQTAEQSFSHALQRARDVNNARTIGESLRWLAQVALAKGDYDEAEERAHQALHLSIEHGRQHASATGYLILGQIYQRRGHGSNAAAAYSQAFNTANALDISSLRCDAITGLASVSLAAGDTALAVRYVEEILPHVLTYGLAGCEEPGWVVHTLYKALQTAHDPRAIEVLRHGADLLERRVMALPQPQRNRYIATFPDRRIVLQTWSDLVNAGRSVIDPRIAIDAMSAGGIVDLPERSSEPPSGQVEPHWMPPRVHPRPTRARRHRRHRPPTDTPHQ